MKRYRLEDNERQADEDWVADGGSVQQREVVVSLEAERKNEKLGLKIDVLQSNSWCHMIGMGSFS